jgi:hypothetical protein
VGGIDLYSIKVSIANFLSLGSLTITTKISTVSTSIARNHWWLSRLSQPNMMSPSKKVDRPHPRLMTPKDIRLLLPR